MKSVKYKDVSVGKYFITNNWIFKKISLSVCNALGYECSNCYNPDFIVTILGKRDLKLLKKAGEE